MHTDIAKDNYKKMIEKIINEVMREKTYNSELMVDLIIDLKDLYFKYKIIKQTANIIRSNIEKIANKTLSITEGIVQDMYVNIMNGINDNMFKKLHNREFINEVECEIADMLRDMYVDIISILYQNIHIDDGILFNKEIRNMLQDWELDNETTKTQEDENQHKKIQADINNKINDVVQSIFIDMIEDIRNDEYEDIDEDIFKYLNEEELKELIKNNIRGIIMHRIQHGSMLKYINSIIECE